MGHKTHTDMAARLRRIDTKIMPEPMSGCHLWIGARNTHGYGIIMIDYRTEPAHRWLYQYNLGVTLKPAPEECVLHRCGTRSCVNMAHLYVGTQKDNTADARRHGTYACFLPGERHWNVKLSDADVEALRGRYRTSGLSTRALAKEAGLSHVYLWQLVAGKKR
jgi:hypothetical protein